MKRFKIGEDEKLIIKLVGAGILVVASLALPGLPLALKPFLMKRKQSGYKRILKRLEEKNVIYLGGDKIKLTKKGKRLIREMQIQDIQITKPAKWDKTWHLVSYDIPEHRKKERDWFAWTLKRLEFERIQKSLWVYPFDCKEEIALIAQELKISPYVIYMNTDHLPRESKFINLFNLNNH